MRHGISMQCITPLIILDACGAGGTGMKRSFYFGNAAIDQVRGTEWFVGQFVPPEMGLRHQTDVELKWVIHPDGDRRVTGAEANRNAATISVLKRGTMRTTFEVDGTARVVT
jgi:hypothetical protein